MNIMELLWRTMNGDYVTTPFGERRADCVYVGSLRQLVDKYESLGRERFLKCLPGVPEIVVQKVEERHRQKQRALAKLEAESQIAAAQAAVWIAGEEVADGVE